MHADNPIDWYLLEQEAIAKAKDNKRILVSVGYSACYCCDLAERPLSFRFGSRFEMPYHKIIELSMESGAHPFEEREMKT